MSSAAGGPGGEALETASPVDDHSGLLIIRAWIEEGSSEPLRAQVRLSTDVSSGFESTLSFARPDQVCAAVHEWLADMLAEPTRP